MNFHQLSTSHFYFLGWMKTLNNKHEALEYKLKKGISVDVLRDENFQAMIKANIDPEVQLRIKRTFAIYKI